jgi:Asp-tRNA(Asn)/Glu-tRNA(Gln) amidotransferase A subunit family amidase
LTTNNVIQGAGGFSNQFINDRLGIMCRTVEDGALVLDALKNPERGYFDPRDIYTALPKVIIPEEPYSSFIVDEKDVKDKVLEGMRIGIVREFMVKFVPNDAAISDQIDNEIKTVLRDRLGAELVESVDPLHPDDPEIPDMEYTFQDAIAEILPRYMPEFLSKKTLTGDLEFGVPGHNVTSYDYMLRLSKGLAPLSDDLNLRRVQHGILQENALTTKFDIERYLIDRGDERVKDWATLFANAKWNRDEQRRNGENWLHVDTIVSEGKTERILLREMARLAILKVMHENDIDLLVNPENTFPPRKLGGPSENRGAGFFVFGGGGTYPRITATVGFPEVIVPAGFNQTVYEPEFVLSADKESYLSVPGADQSLLPNPMPIGIMFWSGPGDEPTLLKAASAYEAATHHRTPPPDFGPLPDGESFPITHMPADTASAGYGVYAQKPARVEYVTEESELVGDKIDSITLRMKSVGTINGTAEIGVLDEDLSVKKLFGTFDVTTLTPTYTDYEFKLTGGELYQIEEDDRIGIKYEGGGFDETSWVSVMLDLEPEDPFDGANSYLQYHYQGAWRQGPDRDLHMTLKQTTAGATE